MICCSPLKSWRIPDGVTSFITQCSLWCSWIGPELLFFTDSRAGQSNKSTNPPLSQNHQIPPYLHNLMYFYTLKFTLSFESLYWVDTVDHGLLKRKPAGSLSLLVLKSWLLCTDVHFLCQERNTTDYCQKDMYCMYLYNI